jgi:putative chitinase
MLLKVGSKGEDVKKLQEKLGTSADGSFGPGTEKLVKEWQSKNGLTADGIIGDSSWAKLFGSETITSQPVANVVIPPSDFKLEKLKGHVPDSVIAQIPDTAAKFNITNPLRLAHFLAQCGHESGGFKAVNENLNYSAKGL